MDKFIIIDFYSIFSQKKNETFYCLVIYNRVYHFSYTVFTTPDIFDRYVEDYSSLLSSLDITDEVITRYDNNNQKFTYNVK